MNTFITHIAWMMWSGEHSGQILDAKDRRDREKRRQVTATAKIAASVGLFLLASWLLLYIYLFAMRQTESRQSAWFQSFVVWLLFEIFFVSSMLVFVQQIFIPMLTMKDVQRVKRRVVNDIVSFKEKTKTRAASVFAGRRGSSQRKESLQANGKLNAAKYFYASYRIAKLYPNVNESAMVASFSTPYPKKSLTRQEKGMSKVYGRKFRFIGQSFSRVGLYLIVYLVEMPPPVQDAITQVVLSSGLGYAFVYMVKLYEVSPLLVLVPVTLFFIIVHVITFSSSHSELRNDSERRALATQSSVLPGSKQVLPIPQSITVEDSHADGAKSNSVQSEKLMSDIRQSMARILPASLSSIDEEGKHPEMGDFGLPVEGTPQAVLLGELRKSLHRVHPLVSTPADEATGVIVPYTNSDRRYQSMPREHRDELHLAVPVASSPSNSRKDVVSVVEMLKNTSHEKSSIRKGRSRRKGAKERRHQRAVGLGNDAMLSKARKMYYFGDTSSGENSSGGDDNVPMDGISSCRSARRKRDQQVVLRDSISGEPTRVAQHRSAIKGVWYPIPNSRQIPPTDADKTPPLNAMASKGNSDGRSNDGGYMSEEVEEVKEWKVRWEILSEKVGVMEQESTRQIEELEKKFQQLQEELQKKKRVEAAPVTAKPFANELLETVVNKISHESAERMRQEKEAIQTRIQYAHSYTQTLLEKQVKKIAGMDILRVPRSEKTCDDWDQSEWKSHYDSFAQCVEEEYTSTQRIIRELQRKCKHLEGEVIAHRQNLVTPKQAPTLTLVEGDETDKASACGQCEQSMSEEAVLAPARPINRGRSAGGVVAWGDNIVDVGDTSLDDKLPSNTQDTTLSEEVPTRVPFTAPAHGDVSYEAPLEWTDLAGEFDDADIIPWSETGHFHTALDSIYDDEYMLAPQSTGDTGLNDTDALEALSSWTRSLRPLGGMDAGSEQGGSSDGVLTSTIVGSMPAMRAVMTTVIPRRESRQHQRNGSVSESAEEHLVSLKTMAAQADGVGDSVEVVVSGDLQGMLPGDEIAGRNIPSNDGRNTAIASETAMGDGDDMRNVENIIPVGEEGCSGQSSQMGWVSEEALSVPPSVAVGDDAVISQNTSIHSDSSPNVTAGVAHRFTLNKTPSSASFFQCTPEETNVDPSPGTLRDDIISVARPSTVPTRPAPWNGGGRDVSLELLAAQSNMSVSIPDTRRLELGAVQLSPAASNVITTKPEGVPTRAIDSSDDDNEITGLPSARCTTYISREGSNSVADLAGSNPSMELLVARSESFTPSITPTASGMSTPMMRYSSRGTGAGRPDITIESLAARAVQSLHSKHDDRSRQETPITGTAASMSSSLASPAGGFSAKPLQDNTSSPSFQSTSRPAPIPNPTLSSPLLTRGRGRGPPNGGSRDPYSPIASTDVQVPDRGSAGTRSDYQTASSSSVDGNGRGEVTAAEGHVFATVSSLEHPKEVVMVPVQDTDEGSVVAATPALDASGLIVDKSEESRAVTYVGTSGGGGEEQLVSSNYEAQRKGGKRRYLSKKSGRKSSSQHHQQPTGEEGVTSSDGMGRRRGWEEKGPGREAMGKKDLLVEDSLEGMMDEIYYMMHH